MRSAGLSAATEQAVAETGLQRRDARPGRSRSTVRGAWPSVFGLVTFFVAWEVLVRITGTPTFVLPTPSAAFERLWTELPSYSYELLYTLAAAGAGLAIGTTVGVTGAIVMTHWKILERSLFPLAVILKLVPFVAIAPLLRIWLGYELTPKIVLASLITFFPVLVNSISGLRATDPLAVEFFRSVGANRWETLVRLRWHGALPYLFAAIKVSVGLAMIGAIVGEFFGAEYGIGKVINVTGTHLDMRGMFAAIMLLAITGVTLTILTNVVERRVLFWHESVRSSSG